MKRRTYLGLLGLEAAVCAAFVLGQLSLAGVFSTALAFPFEQIGLGLRVLSLSGAMGNVLAVVLYAALGLTPLALLPLLARRRRLEAEDGLLGLASLLLFVILYLMVNPELIGSRMIGAAAGAAFAGSTALPAALQSTGKAMLGVVVYSLLCGYAVLRILRLFLRGDAKALARYGSALLGVLGAFFVLLALGGGLGGLAAALTGLRAGNTGGEASLGLSYVFLFIRFAAANLPYILDLLIVLAGRRLLEAYQDDPYAAATLDLAKRLSRFCARALTVTVLTNIGFNLLQLPFARQLRAVRFTADIPLLSLAFALAALLLTRLIAENKKLKDENDAFI